ncbi:MAG: hypothetical protein KJP01_04365 [Gramella sp.]|nr:hypothetical protein [Christiangramia sp.]
MKEQQKIARTILWLARIWGSLIVGIVLFFLIVHLFNDDEAAGTGFKDARDVVAFICFPILTCLGLVLAFKWPGLGGLIAIVALITGIATQGFVIELNFILLIYSPAILYLIYWKLTAKNRQIIQRMKLN